MPVDHHPAFPVPDTPFRKEVLIPGSKLLAIRSAGGRCLAPDLGRAGVEDAVHHAGYRRPELLLVDETAPDVAEVTVAALRVSRGYSLEARVGTETVETEQQTLSQGVRIENLSGGYGREVLTEVQPQVQTSPITMQRIGGATVDRNR